MKNYSKITDAIKNKSNAQVTINPWKYQICKGTPMKFNKNTGIQYVLVEGKWEPIN